MNTTANFAKFCGRVGLVLCLCVVVARPALAYDDPPMRVARLNHVEGEVSFQPAGETEWGWATLNRPMTAGDSLWTGERARAEMHIGSTGIRVGGQTSVSFLNLDDRTVQIQLNSGTINVRVRNLYRDDVFEVDTPNLAFTLLQRGDYRITVDPNGSFTTITLREGQGQINGGGQAFLVDGGSQVQVTGTDYISYDIYDLPGRDSFDQWSHTRDLREERSQSARYVSPELTGHEDLDNNGTWRTDRQYGAVWVPTHVSRDWAPYKEGHWAWVDPWGWTWVDDAPAGFVTSHYGRWAHVNNGRGGANWAWVPPHHERNREDTQRPVYSPALVTFVGDRNASRDFGSGGGVAWVALAPGEVFVPAYQTSPKYVTNVNVTNTVVQQTTITNVVNNNVQNTTYVNQNVVGAVTAVPKATFVSAQPVAAAAVKVAPSAITAAPTVHSAQVAPVRASVMGANKASSVSATSTAAASAPPPKPPPAVVARPVVAKVTPPPPPVAFAQKQQALQANPGKPLDAKAEQTLRAATPPPVVRVVTTAPPVAAVKPVETVAKKPQPATSLNTAQQVHPPAPGTPPAAVAAQNAQQLAAAEKAKQQAAQQQTPQQQQAAAEKAKQQAAAADKAKLEAAQQQGAQQAAAEKAKQQAAAADKAKLEAAQQQATQQAAAEKAKQQAAADKAKLEAAQQQGAQQAAAEKAKQQAAADKAKLEATQQQAAQQAAAEKAKQQAAAADKAKLEATQQQLAAEKSKEQAAAAEKAKLEAAQQLATQQAVAERSKQQAAAAEKAKLEATQQAAQQAAAEKSKQQAAAADKAKLEATQQQAAQQAAAEKSRQLAAQQQATQQQAAAEKAKQEAALQAAERARQQQPEARPVSNPVPQRGAPPTNPPATAAANNGPVRVAEGAQAAKLISQPKLVYPAAAKAANVRGPVRVHLVIGTDGRVKSATIVSGPQPLQAAALENARQRQYQPTMVGGKAVEVETEASIEF
jgi:TonB family protein